jgi:phospholipase C
MPGLSAIDHVVVLMLENRSFDHMLGWLYEAEGNVSLAGQPFDGLTGQESCPGPDGSPVTVSRIGPGAADAYFSPGADPGEGYMATNQQLGWPDQGPPAGTPGPPMSGFVSDYAYTLGWEATSSGWPIEAGTVAGDIMGCFAPEALPVLSALARGYAVCDRWFASVPTETLPNRAFAGCATSQGHMDDKTRTFTSASIFGALGQAGLTWAIYGYDAEPLTRATFTDVAGATGGQTGQFPAFQAAAAAGNLGAYTFLEPSWGSSGNSQHPAYDVALGEQLIHDVYEALRAGPGWAGTLLVVTYDEHGGLYDHVPPPWGATPPDGDAGEFGFGFDRFGVRVPTVLVSPLIEAGTVFRPPAGGPPHDHTSVLATVEQRWGLLPLTRRDAAAPALGSALTLDSPRADDVLAGVTVPASGSAGPAAGTVSHLEEVRDDLVARQFPAGHHAA